MTQTHHKVDNTLLQADYLYHSKLLTSYSYLALDFK